MKIGYARVSTGNQNLRQQRSALKAAGCEKVFADQGVSGGAVIKPELENALDYMREGDTLVVTRLDRLCRSLNLLIETVAGFERRGIELESLHEDIDTTSPHGKLYFHLFGALAEFERDLIRTRTNEGLAAARAAGKKLGRPPAITPAQWKVAKAELVKDDASVAKVAALIGVSPQSIYTRLRDESLPTPRARELAKADS